MKAKEIKELIESLQYKNVKKISISCEGNIEIEFYQAECVYHYPPLWYPYYYPYTWGDGTVSDSRFFINDDCEFGINLGNAIGDASAETITCVGGVISNGVYHEKAIPTHRETDTLGNIWFA